jgi:CSLREA domain-containing protein
MPSPREVVALGVCLAMAAPAQAEAFTYVVNSTADHTDGVCTDPQGAGDCTLREAIEASNDSPGADDRIVFSFGGPGVAEIVVGSPLPEIADRVSIEGSGSPPQVRLRGAAGAGDGLSLTSGAGESQVSGLEITGFPGSGVTIDGSPGAVLIGNLIAGNGAHGVHLVGSGADGALLEDNLVGTSALPNDRIGIFLEGVSDTVVGGVNATSPPHRGNSIVGNGGDGVRIGGEGASNNTLYGNRIGENGRSGVVVEDGSDNQIGSILVFGPPGGAANFVYLNGAHGVRLTGAASGNLVQGNVIGSGLGGMVDWGNALDGVSIEGGVGNSIGGESGTGNLIVFNMRGVHAVGGVGNSLLGNLIHSNDGLGIDLSPPPLVDPGGFPTILSATTAAEVTTITGRLDRAGGAVYRVEVFASERCDASGYGEGARLLGSLEVTTDGGGRADFAVTPADAVPLGQAVTATATDSAGNTSEFSACAIVATPTTEPTTTPVVPLEPPPNARPRLVGATITNPVLRVGPRPTRRRGIAGRAPVGTTFRYRLSEAATVRIAFARRGHREGRLLRRSREGLNRVRFSGRIGRRALRPGRHRATLVATDRQGARSRPVRLTFRVVAAY